MSVPFVGRRDELEALNELISRARRENAPAVGLIAGEPGSGKSRLLREALAAVDPRRLVLVAGFEPTEPVPLAAVGDLVRRLAAVPDHGRQLERLVFGSGEVRGQGALPVFEATHRALSAFGPLVLGIDDLQWVDEQSLGLLHYLVSAAESTRRQLVVIAASRPSPVAVTFAGGIAGQLPEARRASVDLGGLSIDDGVTLVRAIDPTLDVGTAESIWQRSAGSPFWLGALARGRGSTDAVELITDRMRTLSTDAGSLLNALAVGGRPFAHDELVAVVGWRVDRLDHAVRELVGRGLAVREHAAVRLSHDLIREAATNTMPAATRQRLHRRLAELVEGSGEIDLEVLSEALEHRVAAGLPAAELAGRLVSSPRRRLLGADALRRLSSIADGLAPGSADRVGLDAGLGRLAGELGQQELAIRHWSRVGGAAAEPNLRLRADLEAARASYAAGRAADVHLFVGRARELPLDVVTAIELDTIEAEAWLWVEHETAAGAAAAARAVSLGRDVSAAAGGSERLPAATRLALLAALEVAIDAALQEERAADVIALAQEALAIADGLGEEARLRALLRAAFAVRTLGHSKKFAAGWYQEAWEAAHRLVLPMSIIEAGIGFARVLHVVGRIDEALAVARETSALEARIRPWRRWDTSTAVLHWIELSTGKPGALERLEADAGLLDPHFAIAVYQTVATWLARQDAARQAAAAERALDAARSSAVLAGCPRCARELQVVSAEVLARIGRVDEAKREFAAWRADHRGPSYPALERWRARTESTIHSATGHPGAAAELERLARALELDERWEEAIWARLDLGRLLAARGDRAGAVASYTAAAAVAQRIGTAGVGRLAVRALRDLGVRAWRRGSAASAADALASLSQRELEIAGLVAQGSSNREIAGALALSSKTVERHVTNILAKLGARNRTELAGLVHANPGTGFPR